MEVYMNLIEYGKENIFREFDSEKISIEELNFLIKVINEYKILLMIKEVKK